MSRDNGYELENVVKVAETELAVLVRLVDVDEEDAVEGEDQWWIPFSIIHGSDLENIGDEGFVEIPEWFAEKEGIM